jgi:glucosamine-phosphate N-acetyltransferase
MESLSIRRVTIADFDSILELLKQLWPNKTLDTEGMKEMFSRNLQVPNQHYICAETESKIIGFCSLTIKNNLWQQAFLGNVDELVVDENFRGKGVGRTLLDKIIEIAKSQGCVRIELDSGFHREKAHAFYRSLGFESRAYLFSKPI